MVYLFCILALWSPPAASSRVLKCHATVRLLRCAVLEFERTYGRLPTEQEGLNVLVVEPPDWSGEKPWTPYLEALPRDAWGHEYCYVTMPELQPAFGIYSVGADGITLSGGNDCDDINSWNQNAPWLAYYGVQPTRNRLLLYLLLVIVASTAVALFCFAGGGKAKERM